MNSNHAGNVSFLIRTSVLLSAFLLSYTILSVARSLPAVASRAENDPRPGSSLETIKAASTISNGVPSNAPLDGSGWTSTPVGGCSAVALSNWYVLSANHCYNYASDPPERSSFLLPPGSGWIAMFGGTRTSPTQTLQIVEVFRYPGNSTGSVQRVDLILFRLSTPFIMPGSSGNWQLPLWRRGTEELVGRTATCRGWGGGSNQLLSGVFIYQNVVPPFTCNNSNCAPDVVPPDTRSFFRGDYASYSPVNSSIVHEPGDSGSGCFVTDNGTIYLASIEITGETGVSLATPTYRGTDSSGNPRLGVRQWIDQVILPKFFVSITFLNVKIFDDENPERRTKPLFDFIVNGEQRSFPAQPQFARSFALAASVNLPRDLTVTPQLLSTDTLRLTVSLADLLKPRVTREINPSTGRPLREDETAQVKREYDQTNNFGQGYHTERSTAYNGESFEVTYRIDVVPAEHARPPDRANN